MPITTNQVAEHMLKSGKQYTAAMLGKELGISAELAAGKLYNIRSGKRYRCNVTPLPRRTVQVVAIDGRTRTRQQLVNAFLKGLATKEAA
ncbi:TPA: hypothetical protein QD004_002431 [Shewanella algae]|uniref:hypothetical protein n=1 Tax=Shewanella algae TaxID=38313 RepID=UPI000F42A691|nr:hypothetical protein [Shewanella algae]AYV12338.1 hypothetical protein EEY24_05240 [Shewanella algae]HDS1203138.1 hypothetical protein [Shewanella algae]